MFLHVLHGQSPLKKEFFARSTAHPPPSPAKREQRADSGGGVVGVRKTEPVPYDITDDEIHYALTLCRTRRPPASIQL